MRRSTLYGTLAIALVGTLAATIVSVASARQARWTQQEREMLRSLTLSSLEPLQPDPSNKFGDDPRAAALGRELFFDPRLSGNGKVSCASCHAPDRDFQDGKSFGEGVGTTARRTMPVAGTAHSAWMFWDGRADSQWSQALGPLESAVEHGGTRTQYARIVAEHYRTKYEQVFGALPVVKGLPASAGPVADTSAHAAWMRMPAVQRDEITRVYANIGKAIAAYERRIEFGPSRFDRYADAELTGRQHTADDSFTSEEEAGLRLFIGKGSCANCHNGALFSDDHFHNTGVPAPSAALAPDSGRAVGARQVLAGEFNCSSRYSDAKAGDCDELTFADTDGPALVRAYKTPSLRGVAARAPYMHAGQFTTLEQVVAHYSAAPRSPFGHTELKPLNLSADEQRQIVAFLRTLNSPVVTPR